jgi:hypothetical protein
MRVKLVEVYHSEPPFSAFGDERNKKERRKKIKGENKCKII